MDPQPDTTGLARRLRELRKEHWPDRPLTQRDVATALGVGLSSVSSWENPNSAKIPPPPRLASYATLFATRRSIKDGIHPLNEKELTEEERSERDRLAAELQQLRLTALGESTELSEDGPRSPFHWPDGGPIRLICGTLAGPPPYAVGRHPNYMQLASYADIDAMVELFGHLRSENPKSDVRFNLARRTESDDLKAHLILFGSRALNQMTEGIASLVDLPVRQVSDPDIEDGEVFETINGESHRFRPKFADNSPEGHLVEDIGMFFRTVNPNNVTRTLTICSGVFTRGVYGAVRLLTDIELRGANQLQLLKMFGDAHTFGILMRVRVFDHATTTPDLRNPVTVLHQWSTAS